ncbi:MAG: DNA polymerase III subunit beta [Clostridia bacterium]|nr:DNA polymerase III subunit beta [Clostridia bacterium]
MKIVFTKQELLENLYPVMGTVSNKNTITSLEGVLIETMGGNTVRFSTYDMNKGTRTVFEATEVVEGGSYIINAQRLMQIIKVMDNGEITLEVDQKLSVKISCETSNFTMYAIGGADFPGLPELSGDKGFEIEAEKLRSMIVRVLHSVSDNESRPNLCGAYFCIRQNQIKLVSCDAYSLSECTMECEIKSVGEIEEENFSFILPGHALNEIVKLLADKKETVKLYLARKHAILKTEGLIFFTRLIDGEYFDYERTKPKDQTIFVTLERDRLISGLERALLVADEKGQVSGRNYVKIEISNGKLMLISTSSSGRVYDEMPCQHEGEEISIGFNCRYLINNVRACEADTLRLGLKSVNQAMTVVPAEEKEGEHSFYMLLPVRMS